MLIEVDGGTRRGDGEQIERFVGMVNAKLAARPCKDTLRMGQVVRMLNRVSG